jgi:hypothetical protein
MFERCHIFCGKVGLKEEGFRPGPFKAGDVERRAGFACWARRSDQGTGPRYVRMYVEFARDTSNQSAKQGIGSHEKLLAACAWNAYSFEAGRPP